MTQAKSYLWPYISCLVLIQIQSSTVRCIMYNKDELDTVSGVSAFYIRMHLLWGVYIFRGKPHIWGKIYIMEFKWERRLSLLNTWMIRLLLITYNILTALYYEVKNCHRMETLRPTILRGWHWLQQIANLRSISCFHGMSLFDYPN